MTEAAVEFTGVKKQQGNFTLGPLSLAIPTGVIFGLIGPNGAGKTTTFDLLAGLGRADHGSIRVLGMDSVRNEVAIKRRIAYSSPQTSYAAWRSVGGAIEFISGFYADWDAARCDELLTIFALNPWQRISELSFGEVNKLGLLIALARDPDLLILDEPTTGLDPVVRQFLFADLLRRMQRSGQTILIATHQLGELERFADHVALMQQGKITLSGDVASLLERFHQINVALGGAAASPVMPGVTLLARSGDRAGLLVDREQAPPNWRTLLGCDIVTEQALTLEELFLGLVSPSGHRGMQEAVP